MKKEFQTKKESVIQKPEIKAKTIVGYPPKLIDIPMFGELNYDDKSLLKYKLTLKTNRLDIL